MIDQRRILPETSAAAARLRREVVDEIAFPLCVCRRYFFALASLDLHPVYLRRPRAVDARPPCASPSCSLELPSLSDVVPRVVLRAPAFDSWRSVLACIHFLIVRSAPAAVSALSAWFIVPVLPLPPSASRVARIRGGTRRRQLRACFRSCQRRARCFVRAASSRNRGWSDSLYVWHAGYWGPHVGYYGGIDYGFGYTGHGYYGGHWDHETFVYNTTVTRVNTTIIHNTYNETVVANHEHATRVSFNGGPGGVVAKPIIEDRAAAAKHHMPWTPTQTKHHIAASKQRELRASINHGTPSLAAVSHTPALIDRQSNAPQLHTLERHNQHSDRFYPGDSFVPSKHPNHHDPNAYAHDPRGRMISPHDRVQRGSQEFHVQEQRRDRKEPKQGEYR